MPRACGSPPPATRKCLRAFVVIFYFCVPANKCQLQITPIKSTDAVDVATLLNMFVDTASYPGMSIKLNVGSPGMFGTFTGLFRRCPRILARR